MNRFIKIIKKRPIIIIIIALLIIGFVLYNAFFKNKGDNLVLKAAERTTVIKEISETGTVKISEEIGLSFKNSSGIEKIYVKAGDQVKAGQELVKLESTDVYYQLRQAQALYNAAKANYDKLLAGATKEEIKVYETNVLNARTSLENSRQKLLDAELNAKQDLDNAYEDGEDALNDAYLKIYNALIVVKDIERTYFTLNDQEGLNVRQKRIDIENSLNEASSAISSSLSGSQSSIDAALIKTKESLENVRSSLEIVRNMTDSMLYRDAVSSSYKTSLDNQKSYINTSYTNIITVVQTISSTKVANEKNINNAKADVSEKETSLLRAESDLSLLIASARSEEVNLYKAQTEEALAKVSLYQNQINEYTLKAPVDGQITKIDKRQGEIVQPAEKVISFLPQAPFQVKVDIYEEEIVDIKVGNPVKINLVAFPDETLKGEVSSIDPAEKLINNVVYYEVTIDFIETKEGIKPGMTADIVIEAVKKENILAVLNEAIEKINGKRVVEVFKDGKIEEREIEIGLEGNDMTEIVSGISEGEQIVLSKNR
ncbi:MAG: efflux RND transporter periplasmic adaptor subunit [Candidatus Pacebacteria bacterium]|nr:efflux RND transporter periplasmic adaptor subunit [Candidatus Paceibacterota bacterium]